MTEEGQNYTLDSDIQLAIVNISATYSLHQELDLEALSNDLSNAEYNPGQYSSIVFRSFKCTFLIPRSGKVTLVGGKSKQHVEESIQDFIILLDDLGINRVFEPSDIKIQNIVIKGDIQQSIDLATLAAELGFENIEYEPEQFPGLVYHDRESVVLFFASGKFIITGISEFGRIKEAGERIVGRINTKNNS
jgi:transcription initiation factor TFIID TATA-box-binding protein